MKRIFILIALTASLASCTNSGGIGQAVTIVYKVYQGQSCAIGYSSYLAQRLAHLPTGVTGHAAPEMNRILLSATSEARLGRSSFTRGYEIEVLAPVAGQPAQTAQDLCTREDLNI